MCVSKLLRPLIEKWRTIRIKSDPNGISALSSFAACKDATELVTEDLTNAGFVINYKN